MFSLIEKLNCWNRKPPKVTGDIFEQWAKDPKCILRRYILVLWTNRLCRGKVKRYHAETNKYLIQYDQGETIWHPLDVFKWWVEKNDGFHQNHCLICYEPMDDNDAFDKLYSLEGGTEHWEKQQCHHDRSICIDCMTQHMENEMSLGKVSIMCPQKNCSRSFYHDDLKSMVSSRVMNRWKSIRDRDHSTRLLDLKNSDHIEMKRMLKAVTRPCPRCSVIIYRDKGCDEMRCVCGEEFNWQDVDWPRITIC